MSLSRRMKSVIAVATSAVAMLVAVGITPSLASWTDTEFDHGAVAPLDCATSADFTTQAWGQELAGQVAGIPLDNHLAGALGITVNSGIPKSSATGGAGSAGLTYLTNDAWASNLQVGALNSIDLGAGVTLPIGQNLGVETQYGRATTGGVATGASGAVTTSGDGLVSLDTPTSATPGVGSVSLGSALSSIVGTQLSGDVTQLANASLTVGALGSTTQVDSCNALWQGQTDAAAVIRHYVLAKLGLTFDSSLIGTATSTALGSVNTVTKASNATLATALNSLQPLGAVTGTTLNSVTSTLSGLLPASLGGFGVSLGSPTTVQVGVTFDPSSVLSLLNSTLTAGPVSINLATGEIDADIAGLGSLDLNALPPNTNLITPAMLTTLTTDLTTAIANFVTNTIAPALSATLNSAHVTVDIASQVALDLGLAGTFNVVALGITASGSLGNFLQPATYGEPTVGATVTSDATGPVLTLLGDLGLNLSTLTGALTGDLSAGAVSTVLGLVDSGVLAPVLTNATTAVAAAVNSLQTALSAVSASLGTVVGVLGDAVQLTVNAEPDQANPVGSPETAVAGEYFESALKIGVLNGVGGTSALDLFLGSSAVGPNLEN